MTPAHQHTPLPDPAPITAPGAAAPRMPAVTAHIRPRWALSSRLVEHLGPLGTPRTVAAGTVFAHEGDPPDHIHLILSGRVRGFVCDDDRRLVLGEIGAGEYCGEMLVDGFPRCISTATLEPSRLLAIPRAAFMQAMDSDRALRLHVMQKLAMRVITSTELVRRLALTDVRDRVQQFLFEAASALGGPDAPVSISQQAIGDRVGATRSMVNRVLKRMTDDGDLEHTPLGFVLRRPPPPTTRPSAQVHDTDAPRSAAGERTERHGAAPANAASLPTRMRNALLALPTNLIEDVCAHGRAARYAPGDPVCLEGQAADTFCILTRGRLDLTLSSSNGRHFAMGEVLPGEYFGELVMIAGSSRMATVTAVEASEIVHLDRAAFMAVIEHHDELTRHLAVRLAMRLRQLTQLAKQLALLDVQSRMLALLRSLGEPRSDGSCYIAQLPSQQQIGERVGASRSMINRVMREFSACGRIQYRDAGIVLRGP